MKDWTVMYSTKSGATMAIGDVKAATAKAALKMAKTLYGDSVTVVPAK